MILMYFLNITNFFSFYNKILNFIKHEISMVV